MVERGGRVGDASGLNLWAGQYFIFWTCITFTFLFFFLMGRGLQRDGELARGGLNLLASGNHSTSKGNRVVHLIFPENCFSLFRSPESLSDQHQSLSPLPFRSANYLLTTKSSTLNVITDIVLCTE